MSTPAQRTPVSVLFELCTQNEWTAEYELESVIGASHDPTFTYKVQVQNVVATASGQSKKKAKHLAAKSALEQLLANPPENLKNGFYFENTEITAENLDQIILGPSSEPVPVGKDAKNAIGKLQEDCMKYSKPPPYYETVSESGPPHDKLFSVMCIVDNFTTYGEGKTKKVAKRIAAESMLKHIKSSNGDSGNTASNEDPKKEKNLEDNLQSPLKPMASESFKESENSPLSYSVESESKPHNSAENNRHDDELNHMTINLDKILIDSDQDI